MRKKVSQAKETKLQELERRIKALEAVSHEQYIRPCPYPHYPPASPTQPIQPQNPYPFPGQYPGPIC